MVSLDFFLVLPAALWPSG